jgi:hypothetical protein
MNAITSGTSAPTIARAAEAAFTNAIAAGTSTENAPGQSASSVVGQAIGSELPINGGGGIMGTPDPLSAFIGSNPFHDMRLISEPVSIGFPGGVGGEIGSLLGTDPGGAVSSVYPSSLAQFIGATAGFQSEFESVLYNPINDQQTGAVQIQIAAGILHY